MSRLADMRIYLTSYLQAPDYRPSLQHCSVPVTVFIGQKSWFYPEAGQQQYRHWLPDCRLVQFAHSGHLIPLQEPRRFVEELGRFLA